MAIPKRGSRSIVVDGTTYRWYMRKKVSYSQHYGVWNGRNDGTTFAVEHANEQGCVLLVTLPPAHPSIDLRMGLPIIPVVPSQVAHYIALALVQGWQPTKRGVAFEINVAA